MRALGVTSKKRTPVVPDMPAIAETLPGFDINSWTTLTGPAKLPPDVVARLSELSKKALESEDLKAKFLDLAATAMVAHAGRHAGLSATPRKRGSRRSSRRRAQVDRRRDTSDVAADANPRSRPPPH